MPDRRTAILDAAIAVIARHGIRGLRVEEVAAAANVAVSLLYYYFDTRNGLVRATLDHANERAGRPEPESAGGSGYDAVERTLLGEFDGSDHVRETSVVWGEVLASAVFDEELRVQLRAANQTWVGLVAERIRAGQDDGSIRPEVDATACAELLTAVVDGLSGRWLAGLIEDTEARRLLAGAISSELSPTS